LFYFAPFRFLLLFASIPRKTGKDGEDIWLSILGKVFDVTSGKYYGSQGGYKHFSGRDASSAFASGNFDENGMNQDTLTLTPNQIQEIVQWREFYVEHEEYKFMGHLYGKYYDNDAKPTSALKTIEGMLAIAKENIEKEKKSNASYARCNMRHRSNRSEYKCQNPKKVPRKMKSWTMDSGTRCACFNIDDAKSMEKELALEIYHKDCDFNANECIVFK